MIRKMAPIGVAMLLATAAMPAQASDAKKSTFGTLPDGRAVPAVTLSNGNGVSATVIAYGAALQSVIMPDKDGTKADVALGYGMAGCGLVSLWAAAHYLIAARTLEEDLARVREGRA